MINSPFPKVVLGDYVEFQPRVLLTKGESYPFIPMENITAGVRDVYCLGPKLWTGNGAKFEHGDVLFARITPCLENRKISVARVADKGFGSTEYFVLRGRCGKVDQIFLYYLSITDLLVVNGINSFVGASGRQRADANFLKRIEINLPPLDIQKKIAAVLTSYDDLIENNNHRIALLEKMAEEIYREWFVRFRFPSYQNAEFEKGIPKNWNEGSLSQVANILMGQSPKSEFYNEVGDGMPFHQGVGTYGNRFPTHRTYCSVNGRAAMSGDILFSVRAPVGRLNIANTRMIIGRGLAAISHKKGWNSYLFYLLKTIFSDEDIIGNGAIFNSVGKDELMGLKILIPEEKVIEKFEKMVSNFDSQIELLSEIQENLIKTKEKLLPRLISGKLSVTDLDIQFPPSMLHDEVA